MPPSAFPASASSIVMAAAGNASIRSPGQQVYIRLTLARFWYMEANHNAGPQSTCSAGQRDSARGNGRTGECRTVNADHRPGFIALHNIVALCNVQRCNPFIWHSSCCHRPKFSFKGEEELLKSRSVKIEVLHESRCAMLMMEFINENPELWHEDIGMDGP